MQQTILSKLQAQKKERRGSLIYTRGAHGLLKEGAPHVNQRAAKCEGRGRHLSSFITNVE
jgi:hypothetical protein